MLVRPCNHHYNHVSYLCAAEASGTWSTRTPVAIAGCYSRENVETAGMRNTPNFKRRDSFTTYARTKAHVNLQDWRNTATEQFKDPQQQKTPAVSPPYARWNAVAQQEVAGGPKILGDTRNEGRFHQ
jgi:hypothetical protein